MPVNLPHSLPLETSTMADAALLDAKNTPSRAQCGARRRGSKRVAGKVTWSVGFRFGSDSDAAMRYSRRSVFLDQRTSWPRRTSLSDSNEMRSRGVTPSRFCGLWTA